jgi:NAD(P)H-nitrite reductase large subunit
MTDSPRRYVIVGNGFAGTTAAEHLRRLDANAIIDLFADEPYPLYNRIALPPLLRGQVAASKVIMRDHAWHEKHGIRLHLGTRIELIVPAERVAHTATQSFPYDALLLATGGRPNPSTAPGAPGAENILNFQYLDDTTALSERLASSKAAVAVGGSFIAYELAEAFIARGVETHWLIRGSRFLRRMLDSDAAALLDEAAKSDNVNVWYDDEVESFTRDGSQAVEVLTKQGRRIKADLFGVGLGLTINTTLAEGTKIEVRTGFVCNERLETAEPGIFAAGDAAEFFDPTAGIHYRMGTWNNAGAHGKVAAANMAGGNVVYHDVPEYSSKIFTEQAITQFGISPELKPELGTVSLSRALL